MSEIGGEWPECFKLTVTKLITRDDQRMQRRISEHAIFQTAKQLDYSSRSRKPQQVPFPTMMVSSLYSNDLYSHQISV